jgi:hypothetical protein
MIGLLWFVVAVLASAFKPKIRLDVENATFRHQLVVLLRKGAGARSSHERSLVPRPDVSMVSVDPGGRYDRPARNAATLASVRLSPQLALEITSPGRATAVCAEN